MGIERIQKFISDSQVPEKRLEKTASYSMAVGDSIIAVTASAAVVITLPRVEEAAGSTYEIIATSATGTFNITIQDNDESVDWNDLVLEATDDYVILMSTGQNWRVLASKMGVELADKFVESFRSEPLAVKKAGAGAATGTEGDENLMLLHGGNVLEYHIIGTQSIVSPRSATGGLDIGMDQTDDDGVEICPGLLADCPGVYVVGTSPAFYAQCTISVADVSGSDLCRFGFRKLEAYQVDPDDYDEAAGLDMNVGDIYTHSIINNGGNTDTDTTTTTILDGVAVTFRVNVSAAGVVTFLLDGAAPTVTQAFTFDDTEVVVPFLVFRHAAGIGGAVLLSHLEWGYQ